MNPKAILLIGLVMLAPAAYAEKFDLGTIDLTKLPPTADKKGLTYAKDVRPMLETSCLRCHGEEQQKGQLRLDSLEALLKGGKHGKVIAPGKSKESHLVIAAAQIDDETAMPPKRRPGGPGGPGRPSGPGTPGGPPPQAQAQGQGNPGAPRPGGPRGGGGPPAKPLTSEQVALIRAWIDQGGK